jgi:hypothetical protein
MNAVEARPDHIRGQVMPKTGNTRTIAVLTSNPGCSRRAVRDAAGIDQQRLASYRGFPAPFGQPQFTTAGGIAFEAQVKANGRAELLILLRQHLDLPIPEVAYDNLDNVRGNTSVPTRHARTRALLTRAIDADAHVGAGILFDHPLLQLDVGGRAVYLEPDDRDKVAAAIVRPAVRVLALHGLLAGHGIGPKTVVNARYSPDYPASCEMCFFCREEAKSQAAALGLTDKGTARVCAALAERALARGRAFQDESNPGGRVAGPERIAIGVARRDKVQAFHSELGPLAARGVIVDTANRLQGREIDLTIDLHPLSGGATQPGSTRRRERLCVLASRPRHACIVVAKAGIPNCRTLISIPNRCTSTSRHFTDGWETIHAVMTPPGKPQGGCAVSTHLKSDMCTRRRSAPGRARAVGDSGKAIGVARTFGWLRWTLIPSKPQWSRCRAVSLAMGALWSRYSRPEIRAARSTATRTTTILITSCHLAFASHCRSASQARGSSPRGGSERGSSPCWGSDVGISARYRSAGEESTTLIPSNKISREERRVTCH